jgi:serine/threonine protein kinase
MNEDSLFAAALARPAGAERGDYLDAACGGDRRLRDRVEQLLAADELARGILENGPDAAALLAVCRPDRRVDGPWPPAEALKTSTEADPPGYELFEEVGEGGMGVVYRARDARLARDVAVKFLHPRFEADGPAAKRFLGEARVTAQLQHPGVPPVHQVGALLGGRPFLVMKLIKGRTLADLLANEPANRGRLLAAFEQACQAVAYAHAHKVIHRDLKPQNVMVGAFGEVQVMDWGLAKALGMMAGPGDPDAGDEATVAASAIDSDRGADDATRTGSVLGTPAYMPPEQAIGAVDQIDERSDVFGLGAVLCAILTQKPPYVSADFESTRQLAARAGLGDASSRLDASGADPGWVELCKRCLAREKADRPQDAGAVADAVQAIRTAAEERARRAEIERAQAEVEAREQRKRRRTHLAVAAALGLLLAGGGAFAWHSDRRVAARERDERTRLARNAEAVTTLLDQCEADLRAYRLDQAAISLGAAERRAADGGAEDLADRLVGCRAGLEFVRELDSIEALRRFNNRATRADAAAIVERWRAAISAFGIPPDGPPSAETVARVNGSPVRDRLLQALDSWLMFQKSDWVRAVLRAVDPDQYRDAVRDAIAAGNRQAIGTLAWNDQALEQPPRFAAVLGQTLAILPERRRRILGSALLAIPADRDLLFAMGNTYTYRRMGPELDGQIRWFQATVTAHPTYILAHNYLGLALAAKGDMAGAAVSFREAVRLDPTFAPYHFNLADALAGLRDVRASIAHYTEAIRLDPTHILAHDGLAWVLAAGPDGVRDRRRAVEHATRACELGGWKIAQMIDTLAAAHAEAGDFDQAVAYQRKALEFPDLQEEKRERWQERLRLYEQKQPYRDPDLAPRELAPPPREVKP